MDQNLSQILSFRPHRMAFPYGWCGHLPFAAWLMKLHKPRIFVELGTHSGNSYFSFCQAVAEANLETCCYAVDTWEGDEHSGRYGEEIFASVNAHNAQHYASFSNLMRMRFEQALDYFSDGSIDLLHIDGLHTYEAVKSDFESWLPKLSNRSIVLFHDINVREREFGVWKLWGELSSQYPHCSFFHSNGLGVLLTGSAIEPTTQEAIQYCNTPTMRHLFATLASGFISEQQRQELQHDFEKLQQAHQILNLKFSAQQEEARQAMVAQQENAHQALQEVRLAMEAQREETRLAIAAQQEKTNQQINTLAMQLDEKSGLICKQEEILEGFRTQIQENTKNPTELNQNILHLDEQLAAKEQVLLRLQSKERDTHQHIANLENSLQAIKNSFSWKLTRPMRWLIAPLHKGFSIFKKSLELGGGVGATTRLSYQVLRKEGFRGIRWRLANAQRLLNAPPAMPLPDAAAPTVPMAPAASSDGKSSYQEWLRRYDPTDAPHMSSLQALVGRQAIQPLISIIMPVYNPPLEYLRQAIDSIKAQIYSNWELCIADDASNQKTQEFLKNLPQEDQRIKVVFRKENGHISAASNSALELASGEFIALMDNDDMLPPHALAHIVLAINRQPDALLIYSDEDKIDAHNHRYDPYYKCDFNYELFLAQNMICHLGVYQRGLVQQLGGFTLGVEGAQDWDLALKCIEHARPDQIVHIPRVLYHWRAFEGSTALNLDQKNYVSQAQLAVVSAHMQRIGKPDTQVMPAPDVPGLLRIRHAIIAPHPKISILIPTRDKVDLLKQCIDSIVEKSSYDNYEIIVIDNASYEKATLDYFEEITSEKIRILTLDIPFNYSRLNNEAAKIARGEYLCLLNNDIEVITPDWMEEMLSFACQDGVGCVGARLWYPNNTLQHGGVILGIGGVAGHSHKNLKKEGYGYFSRAVAHQSYSAVTAACLLVSKECYKQVGGLDEELQVAFNDVDFCLRVRQKGYRNVWTPYAELYHHESASRGYEDKPEKVARFNREAQLMQDRWGEFLQHDPAYNPNLTLMTEDFGYAWPPRTSAEA